MNTDSWSSAPGESTWSCLSGFQGKEVSWPWITTGTQTSHVQSQFLKEQNRRPSRVTHREQMRENKKKMLRNAEKPGFHSLRALRLKSKVTSSTVLASSCIFSSTSAWPIRCRACWRKTHFHLLGSEKRQGPKEGRDGDCKLTGTLLFFCER